jgi:hypothetical protein
MLPGMLELIREMASRASLMIGDDEQSGLRQMADPLRSGRLF